MKSKTTLTKEQFLKLLEWLHEGENQIDPMAVKIALDHAVGFNDDMRSWADAWQKQAEQEAASKQPDKRK